MAIAETDKSTAELIAEARTSVERKVLDGVTSWGFIRILADRLESEALRQVGATKLARELLDELLDIKKRGLGSAAARRSSDSDLEEWANRLDVQSGLHR